MSFNRGHNDWSKDPGARWYLTRYTARDGSQYGDHIWAESYDAAVWICKARGLGEHLDSYFGNNPNRPPYATPSEMLERRPSRWDWQDLIHCAVHVTHLAVAAGKAVSHSLLDDTSPLHELIHLQSAMQHTDSRSKRDSLELRKRLIHEFFVIERSIPGLRPNQLR